MPLPPRPWPTDLPTLGSVLRNDHDLTAHCTNFPPGSQWICGHRVMLDIHVLIAKYGADFPTIWLNGNFRCQKCGAKGGTIHSTPGPGTPGMGDGSGSYRGITEGTLEPGERERLIIRKRRRRVGEI